MGLEFGTPILPGHARDVERDHSLRLEALPKDVGTARYQEDMEERTLKSPPGLQRGWNEE